jgi:hypothetical protein
MLLFDPEWTTIEARIFRRQWWDILYMYCPFRSVPFSSSHLPLITAFTSER